MEEEQGGEVDADKTEEGIDWPDPSLYDLDNTRQAFCVQASSMKRPNESCRKLEQCFWRRIVWSPDGTHLLAQSDDHYLDIFQLQQIDSTFELVKLFSIRAPSTLLAFEWYPFAQYKDAASWCFVISARHVPIRLIDAYQGRVSWEAK